MFLIDFSVCASKWAGWLVMTPRTSVAWRSCSTLCGRKLQGELCACFLSHRTGRAVGLDGRVWWEIGNQTLSAVGLFQQAESGLGPWGSQLEDTACACGGVCGRQTRRGDGSTAVSSARVRPAGVSRSPSGYERHRVCSAALGGLLSASQRPATAR